MVRQIGSLIQDPRFHEALDARRFSWRTGGQYAIWLVDDP
jgi:hypothetical protein